MIGPACLWFTVFENCFFVQINKDNTKNIENTKFRGQKQF